MGKIILDETKLNEMAEQTNGIAQNLMLDKRRRNIDPEVFAGMCNNFKEESGMSIVQMSVFFGVSKATITRWLKPERYESDRNKKIEEYHKTKMSLKEEVSLLSKEKDLLEKDVSKYNEQKLNSFFYNYLDRLDTMKSVDKRYHHIIVKTVNKLNSFLR